MLVLKDVVIAVASEKTGNKRDGSMWFKHGYKFDGTEEWFNKFVPAGTPLMEKGTVLKEVHYEEDAQYGNEVKQIIIKSMPKPGSTEKQRGTSPTSPKDIHNIKDHPFWFILAYVKDLQIARLKALPPKKDGVVSLNEITDQVVIAATKAYQKLGAVLSGKATPESPKPEPEPSKPKGKAELVPELPIQQEQSDAVENINQEWPLDDDMPF